MLKLESEREVEQFGYGFMLGIIVGIIFKRYGEECLRTMFEASVSRMKESEIELC